MSTTSAPATATKRAFLEAYRAWIQSGPWPWVKQDQGRVDRLIAAVEVTITTDRAVWIHTDTGACHAWKAIGGKGKPTLKALRALAP